MKMHVLTEVSVDIRCKSEQYKSAIMGQKRGTSEAKKEDEACDVKN